MAHYIPEEYGNKIANLDQLQRALAGIKGVSVPKFIGLSHDTITDHLQKNGLDIGKRWAVIQQLMGQPPQLTPEVNKALQQLQTDIKACLKKHPIAAKLAGDLLTPDKRYPNKRLMVRSSGKEDTDKLANAGGNESVANVLTHCEDISDAIAVVLASYISEKSLSQRQIAGDDISAPPFCPVLLQEMIGSVKRSTQKNIVKSGVIYINKSGAFIQAAPGHGELVVNSKGPVDSYWRTRNRKI